MVIKGIRRVLTLGTTGLVLATAGFGTSSAAPAAAQTAAACTVSGSESISPGLGAVPQAESFSFSGTQTCAGTSTGSDTFTGGGVCTEGSIEVGVLCSVSMTATGAISWSCSGGIGWWWGPWFEVHCHIGLFWFWMWVVWTPNPLVQNPVTTVNFTGVGAPVGA